MTCPLHPDLDVISEGALDTARPMHCLKPPVEGLDLCGRIAVAVGRRLAWLCGSRRAITGLPSSRSHAHWHPSLVRLRHRLGRIQVPTSRRSLVLITRSQKEPNNPLELYVQVSAPLHPSGPPSTHVIFVRVRGQVTQPPCPAFLWRLIIMLGKLPEPTTLIIPSGNSGSVASRPADAP